MISGQDTECVVRDFATESDRNLPQSLLQGIYDLDGDTLTTCDNAPNLDERRPTAFEAKSGSGYVLITFKGAKP